MAQDDLLSQEEIDALLKGVSGEEESAPSEASGKARVRPYNPATQHRVIRERLHALDIINERFARYFRTSLFNLIRRSADITVDSVRYQSYSDFSRNVPVPTNLNLLAMKPLRGTALVVFPPNLVFMVVDNLFGGDGRFLTKSEGREFTSTEQRMQEVARVASGYVYYVSLKGVTGSGALDTGAVEAMLPRIRQHVHIPVGVGFGNRDAETARAIGKVADAVVIGSRLIQVIEVQPHERVVAAAMDFLRPVRAALDA